jgi:hypothetical protein
MMVALFVAALGLSDVQDSSSNGGRITGQVIDAASGAPIAGARVTVMMAVDVPGGTFGRRPRQFTTDTSGAFAFGGLEPGQYTLSVDKTGFASYPDVLGDGPPERLTVDDDHPDQQLRISLKKGAVITGRVLDGSGEPQAELSVTTLRRTDKVGPLRFVPNGSGQTNDIGEFRIAGLAAGDYIIEASVRHRGPFEAVQVGGTATTIATTYFPGTIDQSAARVMTLTAGQSVTGLEFAVITVRACHVSGTAVDQSGRPSPHALITLFPDMRQTSGSFNPMISNADDDGTFTMDNVAPGTYEIIANANAAVDGGAGLGAFTQTFNITDDPSVPRRATVTITSADVTGVTVIVDRR